MSIFYQKYDLLRMQRKKEDFKIVIIQVLKSNTIFWCVSINTEKQNESGYLVDHKGEVKLWRSLDTAFGFITKKIRHINSLEIKILDNEK